MDGDKFHMCEPNNVPATQLFARICTECRARVQRNKDLREADPEATLENVSDDQMLKSACKDMVEEMAERGSHASTKPRCVISRSHTR